MHAGLVVLGRYIMPHKIYTRPPSWDHLKVMKMTPRHDVWDHRTRWKSEYNIAPNIQDHFRQLETLKVSSSPSVPCLEMIGKKSSWGTSTDKDLNSKPRKVLMLITKGNSCRTLAKRNSLPSICSPKRLVEEYQEQKLENNILRTNLYIVLHFYHKMLQKN